MIKRILLHPIFYVFLLGFALSIRLAYVFLLPLGQHVSHSLEGLNDEPSHFNYVHYLAKYKQFPVQLHNVQDADAFVRNDYEYYQPPVYYILGAVLELLFGKGYSLIACRLISLAFGILSLLVIKKICSRVGFPQSLGHGVIIFAAFFPTHAYFCSVVSNDSLSWLFALVLILETTAIKTPSLLIQSKRMWFFGLRVGLLLGLGMLVKSSLFIFYPVMVVVFLYLYYVSKNALWLGVMAASLFFSILLAGPWYLHNMRLYGSLFASEIGNGAPQITLFSGEQFIRFLKWTLYSFWFPMQHVPASHMTGNFMRLETMVLIINMLLFYFHFRQNRRSTFLGFLFCFIIAINIAVYIKYNLFWSNADGRFFLPSFFPILCFFCVPLYYLCNRFNSLQLFLPLLCFEALFPYALLLLVR